MNDFAERAARHARVTTEAARTRALDYPRHRFEQAARCAARAAGAADASLRRDGEGHERAAAAHEEVARIHERAASVADSGGDVGDALEHRHVALRARAAADEHRRSVEA